MRTLFLSAALAATAVASVYPFTIDPETRMFIDAKGRKRIMHGMNVVVKLPPFLPTEGEFNPDMSLTTEDFNYMKSWGVGIVRLGVMWEAVETSPGYYDMAYLDKVEDLINQFGSHGIVVIVDNHQDLFSRRLCGEGVPWFYTPQKLDHRCPKTILAQLFHLADECISLEQLGLQYDADGNPLIEDCAQQDFMQMYTAPEVASAFSALYQNEDGLLDKLMAFWAVVSSRFQANQYVIGYDILNEPWAANMYHQQSLFLHPESFDRDILFGVAQQASQTVRANNNSNQIIFFEPAQFPDTLPFFGGHTLPIGFPETPGGAANLNKQALNDHSYCCQAAASACADGEPPLSDYDLCRAFHQQKVDQRAKDAESLGVPLIFTEFGACFDTVECALEINNSADAFESKLASWIYWQYKGFGDFTTTGGNAEGMFNDDGTPQELKVKAIARTYVTAYQGTPTYSYFSTTDGSYATNFVMDKSIDAQTVMFRNLDIWYSNGYKLTISDADKKGWQLEGAILSTGGDYMSLLNWWDENVVDGKTVNMLITPTVQETEGSITTQDSQYKMDWTFTDTGLSGACPIKVTYDKIPHNITVNLMNSKGEMVYEFGKTYGSNGYDVACYELIDAKLSMFSHSTSWSTQTVEIAHLDLNGVNGHDIDVSVKVPDFVIQ